jgi:hypothetical protein
MKKTTYFLIALVSISLASVQVGWVYKSHLGVIGWQQGAISAIMSLYLLWLALENIRALFANA